MIPNHSINRLTTFYFPRISSIFNYYIFCNILISYKPINLLKLYPAIFSNFSRYEYYSYTTKVVKDLLNSFLILFNIYSVPNNDL